MATYNIRYVREKLSDSEPVTVYNSDDAIKYLLKNCYTKEELWREKSFALFLNKANQIIGHMQISMGGLEETTFDKKLIIKGALDSMACAIIVSHNHPTGNCLPSQSDIRETEKLKKACSIMEIKLLDHLIIGEKEFFSFSDEVKNTYSRENKRLIS